MLTYQVTSLSKSGGRSENQDSVQYEKLSDQGLVCVLADGLGGHQGGSTASRLAVKTIIDSIQQTFDFSPEGLKKLQLAAQQAIVDAQQQPGFEAMRSTLVLLVIWQDQALWLHCGDSRLYHIREGQILAQTNDHSVPGLFVAAEEITMDEIRQHPDRNKVLRSLGGVNAENKATVIKKPVKLAENDLFLLCSDGFWEYVLEEEMLSLWSGDLQNWLQSMEALIIERAEEDHDNYTACVIQVQRQATQIQELETLENTAKTGNAPSKKKAKPALTIFAGFTLGFLVLLAGILITNKKDLLKEPGELQARDNGEAIILQHCEQLAGSPNQNDITGSGVDFDEIDASRAVSACQKALQLLPADAKYQYLLGRAYHAQKDYQKAIKYYRQAAELGYARAQNNLGWMYAMGAGLPLDFQQAVAWSQKAAEQGHADAQYNLGLCYEYGGGVPIDIRQARYWYQKAAEQGHERAINHLQDLDKISSTSK
jgi:PPM family protein phosphatase